MVSLILIRFYVVAILIGFCSSIAGAAGNNGSDIVAVKSGAELIPLRPHLQFLEDPQGQFTINEVASGKAGEFHPIDLLKNPGYGEKVYWTKITLDFSQFKEPFSFFRKDYQNVGALTIYRPSENGYVPIGVDEFDPYYGRHLFTRDFIFEIPTPETPVTTYYTRLEPRGHLGHLDLSWVSTEGLVKTVQISQLWLGLFFGSLLALLFYNGILYSYTNNKAYLYYVYYLACFIAVFTDLNGYSSLIFNTGKDFAKVYVMCVFGMIHGVSLLTRDFLNLKENVKWMDSYLRVVNWILLVGALSTFIFSIGTVYKFAGYAVLLVFPASLFSALLCWKRGYEPAKIFCLGWSLYVVMAVIFILRSLDLVPTSVLTTYGMQAGAVWEAAFFSLALGYRIKLADAQKKFELEAERNLLEQRVADRTKSLQKSLLARRMIIANASHELRTPVNALRLLLDSNTMSGTDASQVLPRINAIAGHMSQLVENLLLLDPDHPIESQRGMEEDFDLGEEILATASLVNPLRQGSSATFKVDIDQCRGLKVRGDLSSLRRILINLLSNAFKFTEHGSINLIATAENDDIEPRVWCTIRVQDTGLGISAAMKERLFEAFSTSSTQDGHVGTGLGLAISRQLAHHLDGSLRLVRSEENEGSEFECVVSFRPALDSKIESIVSDDVNNVNNGRCLTVLLAEDDPITAQAVQLIIRLLQHQVVHTETYEELQEKLIDNEFQFDYALIDHRLPGGNGLDLIKYCRDHQLAKTTKMILMTADATPEVLGEAQIICDEVITKPTTAYRIRQILGTGVSVKGNHSKDTELIDRAPLTMLKRSGASDASLTHVCNLFYKNISKTIADIKLLLEQNTSTATNTTTLRDTIHRLRSACVTIGAIALGNEFQILGNSHNDEIGLKQLQLDTITNVFEETKIEVCKLLNDLKGINESS